VVKKKPKAAKLTGAVREMAAGEFKAKCLAIMDELNETGGALLVTKRGKPSIKIFPAANENKRNPGILGRLEGVIKINGDPDDLVKPIFPLEDWDMLK
jgi:antitoxin (DNA-binding transcriptional repressor) of toxin-antitoxin stability system